MKGPATPPPFPPQIHYVARPALPEKEVGYAYGFMLFTLIGIAGVQHFYLGKVLRGIIWLLTFGLFGIGTIIDILTLPSQTRAVNARRAVGIS